MAPGSPRVVVAVEEWRAAAVRAVGPARRRVGVHDDGGGGHGAGAAAGRRARRGRALGAVAGAERGVWAEVVEDALEDVSPDADGGLVGHLGVRALVDAAQPHAPEHRLRAHLPREPLPRRHHLLLSP